VRVTDRLLGLLQKLDVHPCVQKHHVVQCASIALRNGICSNKHWPMRAPRSMGGSCIEVHSLNGLRMATTPRTVALAVHGLADIVQDGKDARRPARLDQIAHDPASEARESALTSRCCASTQPI
jgi:hypothetical protein